MRSRAPPRSFRRGRSTRRGRRHGLPRYGRSPARRAGDGGVGLGTGDDVPALLIDHQGHDGVALCHLLAVEPAVPLADVHLGQCRLDPRRQPETSGQRRGRLGGPAQTCDIDGVNTSSRQPLADAFGLMSDRALTAVGRHDHRPREKGGQDRPLRTPRAERARSRSIPTVPRIGPGGNAARLCSRDSAHVSVKVQVKRHCGPAYEPQRPARVMLTWRKWQFARNTVRQPIPESGRHDRGTFVRQETRTWKVELLATGILFLSAVATSFGVASLGTLGPVRAGVRHPTCLHLRLFWPTQTLTHQGPARAWCST